jgi:tetratricopeptide (TPR) repeat protein
MLDLQPSRVRRLVTAGLVHPGRGQRGEYHFSFVDLVVLRTARDLLRQDVPFPRVRRALEHLRDTLPAGHSIAELRIDAYQRRVVIREDAALWDAESDQGLLEFPAYELAAALAPAIAAVPPAAPLPAALTAGDWYELGSELEMTSAEEACAAYRKAIEADPEHVDARVNLGRLLHESGAVIEAERHYRQALRLRSTDLTARFNLGVALEDMGRLPEARNAYRETVLADPEHADAHFNLAGVLERLGQKHQALKHLQAYRRIVNGHGYGADDSAP